MVALYPLPLCVLLDIGVISISTAGLFELPNRLAAVDVEAPQKVNEPVALPLGGHRLRYQVSLAEILELEHVQRLARPEPPIREAQQLHRGEEVPLVPGDGPEQLAAEDHRAASLGQQKHRVDRVL